jgi:hypothetical protein
MHKCIPEGLSYVFTAAEYDLKQTRTFSYSSVGGARGNSAYHTSPFEDVCTLTPVLVPPFISRGAPRQTARETPISERKNYGLEMTGQI